MKFKHIVTILVLVMVSSIALADQEGPNELYVTGNGPFYLKCIPAEALRDREKGKTMVYLAGKESDTLIHTFDWYSPRAFITGWGGGTSVIRLGPWPRGSKASASDLGIAFYRDEKLVARYSTLDLAGNEGNVSVSVSHYGVIKDVIGIVRVYEKKGEDILSADPEYAFEIVLHDGRRLLFDIHTGKRVKLTDNMFTILDK